MAERTPQDYNSNLNELYRLAKANNITTLERSDFDKKITSGPGYRSLIYNGLKKAGVEGIGANQSEFVSYFVPQETAQRQVAQYNSNARQKPKSTPKSSAAQQAQEVGQMAFGGDKQDSSQFTLPDIQIPEGNPQIPADDWRAQALRTANQAYQTGAKAKQAAKDIANPYIPTREDFANGSAIQTFGGGAQWMDANGKVHKANPNELDLTGRNRQIGENIRKQQFSEAVAQNSMSAKQLEASADKVSSDIIKSTSDIADDVAYDILANLNLGSAGNGTDATVAFAQAQGDANKAMDPNKIAEDAQMRLEAGFSSWIKNNQKEIETAASTAQMPVEAYINKYVAPMLFNRFGQNFEKAMMQKYMPKNDTAFILSSIEDWIPSMVHRVFTESGSQWQYKTAAKEAYREHAGAGARFAEGGMGFVDPTFAPLMGAGSKAGQFIVGNAVNYGRKALVGTAAKTAVGRALSASADYAAKFGTIAERNIARILSQNQNTVARIAKSIPGEMIGQGLGMNFYGAASGGMNTFGISRSPLETGKAVWDGLTDSHGFISGAAFGMTMPWLHGVSRALGYAAGDTMAMKATSLFTRGIWEGMSVPLTAGVMVASNEVNKWLDEGENYRFDPTLNEVIDETVMAAAMKFNPNLLFGIAKGINKKGGVRKYIRSIGEYEEMPPLPFELDEWDRDSICEATGTNSLKDALYSIFPESFASGGKASAEEVQQAQMRFLKVMNSLPWDTQNKLAMGLTNSYTLSRPRTCSFGFVGNDVLEYDKDGRLLSRRSFETEEEREGYLAEKRMFTDNLDLWDAYSVSSEKSADATDAIIAEVAEEYGCSDDDVRSWMVMEPLRRTSYINDIMRALAERLKGTAYPSGEVHVAHSHDEGSSVATDAGLGTDNPQTEPVQIVSKAVDEAMVKLQEALSSPDTQWADYYRSCIERGMTDEQAYQYLAEDLAISATELAPLADAINAKSTQQGVMEQTQANIEQSVSKRMNTITGGKRTIDGVENDGTNVVHINDTEGNDFILVAGDIRSRADNGIESDQPIIVMDANGDTHSRDAREFTQGVVEPREEYENRYREELGFKSTTAIDPEGKLNPANQPAPVPDASAEGEERENGTDGNGNDATVTSENSPLTSASKDNHNNSNSQENPQQNEIPTDENGEPKLTAEGVTPTQAIDYIYNRSGFSEKDADGFIDEMVESAQKKYDKENKEISRKKGEMPNAFNRRKEEQQQKIADAKRELERWNAIKAEADKYKQPEEQPEEGIDNIDDVDIEELEGMPELIVAQHMPKITPESFKRETGLGSEEIRKMPGLIASKEKGGMSVETASEQIMEFMPSHITDDYYVRNWIIDILKAGGPRSYIKQLKERLADERERKERLADAERDEFYEQHNHGLDYEETKASEADAMERGRHTLRGTTEQELAEKQAEEAQKQEAEQRADEYLRKEQQATEAPVSSASAEREQESRIGEKVMRSNLGGKFDEWHIAKENEDETFRIEDNNGNFLEGVTDRQIKRWNKEYEKNTKDLSASDGTGATTGTNKGRVAQTTDKSARKDTKNPSTTQEPSQTLTDKSWGKQNKIITKDKKDELMARLKEKMNRANSGVDPELLEIGTKLAMYHIEAGAHKFTDFVKAMVKDLRDAGLGEKLDELKKEFKSWYAAASVRDEFDDISDYFDERKIIKTTDVDKVITELDKELSAPAKEETNWEQYGYDSIMDTVKNGRKYTREELEKGIDESIQLIEDAKKGKITPDGDIDQFLMTHRGWVRAYHELLSKIKSSSTEAPVSEASATEKNNKQPQQTEMFAEEKTDTNNLKEKNNGTEETDVQPGATKARTGGQQPDKNDAMGGSTENKPQQPKPERVDRRDGTHSTNDKAGDRRVAVTDAEPEGNAKHDVKEQQKKAFAFGGLEPSEADAKETLPAKLSPARMTQVRELVDDIMGRGKLTRPENGGHRYYKVDGVDKRTSSLIGELINDELKGQSRETHNATDTANTRTIRIYDERRGKVYEISEHYDRGSQELRCWEWDVKNPYSEKIGEAEIIRDTPKRIIVTGIDKDTAEKLGGQPIDKNGVDKYIYNKEKDAYDVETVKDGYVFAASKRDKVAQALGKEMPKKPNERNYRKPAAEPDYGKLTPRARMNANVEAIELLHRLMEEGREATDAEKAILARFSGWGGMGITTDKAAAERIKALIGEEAYKEMALAANSSYYTPSPIIKGMWKIAEMLGFKGGKILEGSAGIGNILSLMPNHISADSSIHAVEKDSTTGNILRLLYPDAKVDVKGFEETEIENGSVDLAITNVPFVTGLHAKDKSGDRDLSDRFKNIHDFCIAKNIRKLKEGGVGIFITSSGTMDSSRDLRLWMDKEGDVDVIGAFRLNGKTFGGTDATSDIIIVRKRINGEKSPNAIDIKDVVATRTVEVEVERGGKKVFVQKPVTYNKYYVEHPENMGGEMKLGIEEGDTRFGGTTQGLYGDADEQTRRFNEWVNKTAKEVLSSEVNKDIDIVQKANEKLGKNVKEGSLVINSKGEICIARKGEAVIPSKTTRHKDGTETTETLINNNKVGGRTKAQCLTDYNTLREALSEVIKYQQEHDTDEGLKPLLDKLNQAYDNFISLYGGKNKMITGNTSLAWLRNDVDFANIAGLESVKEVLGLDNKMHKYVEKGDIFSKRVIVKDVEPNPQNVQDGVVASIFKHNKIDLDYLSSALGKDKDAVRKEILDKGLGFEDPATKNVVVMFDYLSGNVREKLRMAEQNNKDGRYDKNIEALKRVMPMDIPAHMIGINLGANWVKQKVYQDFIHELTGVRPNLTLSGGTWSMPKDAHEGTKNATYGVQSEKCGYTVFGTQLIEAAMRNTTITVQRSYKDRSSGETVTIKDPEATQACMTKISEIRDLFRDWVQDRMRNDKELADEISGIYNEQFNNYVPKSIPDEFVPKRFPGATTGIKLHTHQAKAAIRATMAPVLFAHEVGTGKTFTQITTAMEMRRLGTAKKPMIVVQNATTGQFVASAKALYPGAKILTISDKDTGELGRKNFYAKIKYNDWDMVIVPQSVLDRIPDSVERQMQFIKEKIDEKLHALEALSEDSDAKFAESQARRELEELEDSLADLAQQLAEKKSKKDDKKIAKTTENARIKAEEMLERDVDDVEDFDQLGIDAIIVDEAHEYKHLGFSTAMQRGVKGVDPSYAKKGQGLYLKVQSVLERNNGKNVVFATGTPVSNTAAETWTFLRYLMPKEQMEAYGIYYFDDFARNFGKINQMLEFSTSGKFRENTRFSGYVNVPELIRIWSSVADTVLTKDQKNIMERIPETVEGGDKATVVTLPQTPVLRGIMNSVRRELERFEQMDGKDKKANSHIPLVMFGVASKAAIDPRLVLADAKDDPGSKANKAVENILQDLEESKDYNGAVALFCDRFARKEIETAEDGSIVFQTERGKVKTDKEGEPIPKYREAFNVYEDIKQKLIARGVPASQIEIVKSGMSIDKKQKLFDKVNRGEVRVIMGSTQLLGVGVNIQERLYAEHHLDVPNRPMDWTQRLGRMLRQGNLHKEWGKNVKLYTYAVEDSLDITGYQRLQTKGNIAKSIMEGGKALENSLTERTVEEEEDEFGDVVANLSGSEFALKKQQEERKLRRLQGAKKQWESQQIYIHNEVPKMRSSVEGHKQFLEENKAYLAKVQAAVPDGKPKKIKIGKLEFADVASMEDFFKEQNVKLRALMDDARAKAQKGEETKTHSQMSVDVDGIPFEIHTYVEGRVSTQRNEGAKAERTIKLVNNDLGISRTVKGGWLKNAIEEITGEVVSGKEFKDGINYHEERIKKLEGDIKNLEDTRSDSFAQEAELLEAQAKVDEYTEAMRKEMEEKEKKYANMDVEEIDINSLDREMDDDADEGNAEDTSLLNNSKIGKQFELDEKNELSLQEIASSSYTTRSGKFREGLNDRIKRLEAEARSLRNNTDMSSSATDTQDTGKVQEDGGRTASGRTIEVVERELAEAKQERSARINEAARLRQQYHISNNGEADISDVERMFREFNGDSGDKEVEALFDKVLPLVKSFRTKFFVKNGMKGVRGVSEVFTDKINLNIDALSRSGSPDRKAGTILHEMIHQVTDNVISAWNSVIFRRLLNNKTRNAMETLVRVYAEVKKANLVNANGDIANGARSIKEMMSDLAKPEFREALRSIEVDNRSALECIKDFFKSLLGIDTASKRDTALNLAERALDDIMENYDDGLREKYKKAGNALLKGLGKIDDFASRFQKVEDEGEIRRLENEEVTYAYRSMALVEEDGKKYLVPPMASRDPQTGKYRDKILVNEDGTIELTWLRSDENPDDVPSSGRHKGKYHLVKDNGNDLWAAYNPYNHLATTMLNDQFAEAQDRPNLVSVRCAVPVTEVDKNHPNYSGYHAEKALDPVGTKDWKAGIIQGELTGTRELMLSRWCKPVEIMDNSKVAEDIYNKINGQIDVMPTNVVPPAVREHLEKMGVKFVKTDNTNTLLEGEHEGDLYTMWYGKKAESNRAEKFRKAARAEGIGLEEWMKREGREGQLSETTLQKQEALHQKMLEKDRANSVRFRIADDAIVSGSSSAGETHRIAIRQHIEDTTKKLGTEATMHTSDADITDKKVLKALKAGKNVKGWFDPKTGKVHLYMPNIHSRHDAEKTIWHEMVGHKGLRNVMGSDNYIKFLSAMYQDKQSPFYKEMHDFVNARAQRNGWQLDEALDEWFAKKAEEDVTPQNLSLLNRIRNFFVDAIRKIGYTFNPNINDIRYLLWLSKRGVGKRDADPLWRMQKAAFEWKLSKSKYMPEIKDGRYVDNSTRLRDEEERLTPMAKAVVENYNRRVSSRSSKAREAFVDSMESLRILQEEIGGKNVKDSENAYIAENQVSSIAQSEWDKFRHQHFKKIEDAVNACVGLLGGNATESKNKVEDYLMQKHGLERNRSMFVDRAISKYEKSKENAEAVKNKRYMLEEGLSPDDMADMDRGNLTTADDLRNKWADEKAKALKALENGEIDFAGYLGRLDYFITEEINSEYDPNKNDFSGISSFDEIKKSGRDFVFDEAKIIGEVMDMESLLGKDRIDNLWKEIKKATDYSLDYAYNSGQMNTSTHDYVKSMYNWYVPLRGFREESMEDLYDYMSGNGEGGDPVLKHAEGRRSIADSPLSHISTMANTAILKGERNKMLQKFYRLNVNHKNDAVSISEVWEVKVGTDKDGNDIWEAKTADIKDNDDAETIINKVDDFNSEMRTLQANGEARIATDKLHHDRSFRNKLNANKHAVQVQVNGKTKVMYINGDPRAALALNGKLVNDSKTNTNRVNRWAMNATASLATSYSPEFIVSNTSRDTFFSNANIATKEGFTYWRKFTANQARSAKLMTTSGRLLSRYYDGEPPRNAEEKLFYEFMDNGGRTGFIAMQDLDSAKQSLKASIKGTKLTDKSLDAAITVGKAIPGAIEALNTRAELINRFATYLTSREMGRSIMRSVDDAKNVSVNFNRHGSGSAGQGNYGAFAAFFRNNYMFFNAGMQSLDLLAQNYKNHPVKTVAYMGLAPMIVGTAFAMLMAGDDDESYSNIPSWDRRNNICIPVGKSGYIKLPLPIEIRAFWGMGDIIASMRHKRLRTDESIPFALVAQISQALPIDVLEGGEKHMNIASVASHIAPTAIRPWMQYLINEDWTGRPIRKQNPFNRDAPAWTQVYNSTPIKLVEFSKFVHDATRDGSYTAQETDPTGIQIDPAFMEHMLKSYFGGAYSMVVKSLDAGDRAMEGDFKVSRTPLLSRLWGDFSEREADQTTNAKYWAYKREADAVAAEFSNKGNKVNPLAMSELRESARGQRYRIIKMSEKRLENLNKMTEHLEGQAKIEAQAMKKQVMRDLVDALDAVDD